jgi:hypothetical protein
MEVMIMIERLELKKGYTIRCEDHAYVVLERDGKFVLCLDNDVISAEEIIYRIERETRMDFRDIPVKGKKDDFNGLQFQHGGRKRNFWKDFPNKEEIYAVDRWRKEIIL